MPSNTENVKLGVCSVTFDGVDLGYTQGGVEVTVETQTKKVMVDQFGNSEINEYILSRSCKAKVPLAETTLENLVRIMPGAVLFSNGGTKASGTVTLSTAVPVDGDKVTVNGVDFTFKTAPLNANHVAIGATFAISAQNMKNAINASINALVSRITVTGAAAILTVTADDAGTAGNAITLAATFATGANVTVSGAVLAGGTAVTKKGVSVPNGAGISLLSLARKLVLHPIANDPTDPSEDFVIPLAMTAGAMSFSFKLDQERLFPVEFSAYPDSATKRLFYVGDETATA